MLRRVLSYKLTDVSEVLTSSIITAPIVLMEAVSKSEKSKKKQENVTLKFRLGLRDIFIKNRVNKQRKEDMQPVRVLSTITLTPLSNFLLEKLIFAKPVNEFSSFM
jgi:hypothetical protein